MQNFYTLSNGEQDYKNLNTEIFRYMFFGLLVGI